MAKLQKFLEDNDADPQDEEAMNALINEFNEQISGENGTDEPETAEDFIALAGKTFSDKQRLKYAKKALELDPGNIDAEVLIASAKTDEPQELLDKLCEIKKRADEKLRSEGYFDEDSIGDFWMILETRPYMRLLHGIVESYIGCSKFRMAAKKCEEMLRLCENDNLAIRYKLMAIYARLEDENAALSLHKKFDNQDEGPMLLPLILLFYKLDKYDKAKEYLDRLAQTNKDTKRFFKALRDDDYDDLGDTEFDFGYRPFTVEELAMAYFDNDDIYDEVPGFAEWAFKNVSVKKNKAGASKKAKGK